MGAPPNPCCPLRPDPPSPRRPCAMICTGATSSQIRMGGYSLWGTGDRHSGQLDLVHPLHISRSPSSWVCDVDESGRTQGTLERRSRAARLLQPVLSSLCRGPEEDREEGRRIGSLLSLAEGCLRPPTSSPYPSLWAVHTAALWVLASTPGLWVAAPGTLAATPAPLLVLLPCFFFLLVSFLIFFPHCPNFFFHL